MEEVIYSDCQLLISNFAQNENPSFQCFCEEWQKMHFQHIFTAQTSYIELQQTVAAAYHTGKRWMCERKTTADSADNFNIFDDTNEASSILLRIGALYLLYGIYFKQPLECYTKIEVSLETWREMKTFISVTLPTDNVDYDEARFVFWKLYQSQAFRFTCLDFCVGLENLVDYDNLDKSATNSSHKSFVGVNRLFENQNTFNEIKETTPALVALEEGYNKMKKSLTEMHKLDGQLLPPINIFQQIRNSFEKIENVLNKSDETEATDQSINQKSLKRSLKDKAFACKDNATSSNKIDVEKKSNSNARRMSSRTIFSAKLPKETENDLDASDSDSDISDSSDDNDLFHNEDATTFSKNNI